VVSSDRRNTIVFCVDGLEFILTPDGTTESNLD